MSVSRILSSLIYLVRDEKVLMLHRIKKINDIHQNKYNGLGGKLEIGETPLDCVKREVKEESGFLLKKIVFKGNMYFPKFDKQGNDWQVYLFRGDHFEGEIMSVPPEGKLLWVDYKKVFDLNLWEGDKIFLKHLLDDKIIDAKFEYVDGKLKDHRLQLYDN